MSEHSTDPTPLPEANPSRPLVWDLPTRLFHWTFAGLFATAFLVALLSSEHSRVFLLHMLAGLAMAFAVLLRIGWGLVGSRPSRFSAFLYRPMDLARYLRAAFEGRDQPTPGHNPAASYAVYAMLLLPLGLVATGLLKTSGWDWAEEVHGALAYGLLAVVVLHLAGLVWHSRRHRDRIALAMVDGRRSVTGFAGLPSHRIWAGALFLVLMGGWGFSLAKCFDPVARQVTLPLLGITLPLDDGGDSKEKGGRPNDPRERGHHDDD